MKGYKRTSVILPLELLEAVDAKCKENGMTRQQTLVALIDMGLRGAIWPNAKVDGVLGPLATTFLLRRTETTNNEWAVGQFRAALWQHLRALLGSKTP